MTISEEQIKLGIRFSHHGQHFFKVGGWNTVLKKLRIVMLEKDSGEKKAGTHEVKPNLSLPFRISRTFNTPSFVLHYKRGIRYMVFSKLI